jgi:8-amino-7-oxononanoate synthase
VAENPVSQWLAEAAAARADAGLHRVLKPRPARSTLLDLASNDYLGLSRDGRVVEAAVSAVRRWGTGSTGSRLVTGTTELHLELESAIAALVGAPAALVFSSGYLANLAAVTALAGPDCVIISDAGNHASLVDACRLAKSPVVITPRGDRNAAARALEQHPTDRAIVVLDAINSADGELLDLAEWHRLTHRFGALLVVDDAHGLGVRGGGRGAVFEAGIAGEPDVITTVTLSKALGSQGGAVLGSAGIREHLIDTARTFIFDTGLNPAAVGAALEAVRIVRDEPDLAKVVLSRGAELAAAAGVPPTDSAVIPVVIGEPQAALAASNALRDRGIMVGCFRPPAVPPGTARLRVTARATLTDADVVVFHRALTEVLAT